MFTTLRFLSSVALHLFLLASLTVGANADQRQTEDALKSDLKNKIVILRGFYEGSQIRFDANGSPVGKVKPGYWSSDGMLQISDVLLDKHGRLLLRGRRVINGFDSKKCQFVNYRTKRKVEIEIDVDPSWQDATPVRALMDKILLREIKELKSIVPEYWQSWFVMGGLKRVVKDGDSYCETEPKQSAGVTSASAPENRASAATIAAEQSNTAAGKLDAAVVDYVAPDGTKVYKIGKGVKLPKPLSTPDPYYTEAAMEASYQGKSVLRVVVNERGETKSIRIVRPLGAGLDDRAVEAVRTWKFAPVTYNGVPVAVQIHVEVNFRLFSVTGPGGCGTPSTC